MEAQFTFSGMLTLLTPEAATVTTVKTEAELDVILLSRVFWQVLEEPVYCNIIHIVPWLVSTLPDHKQIKAAKQMRIVSCLGVFLQKVAIWQPKNDKPREKQNSKTQQLQAHEHDHWWANDG